MTEYPRIIEGDKAFAIALLAGVPIKTEFTTERTATGYKVTACTHLEQPVIVRQTAPDKFDVLTGPSENPISSDQTT